VLESYLDSLHFFQLIKQLLMGGWYCWLKLIPQ